LNVKDIQNHFIVVLKYFHHIGASHIRDLAARHKFVNWNHFLLCNRKKKKTEGYLMSSVAKCVR
jgi:hypothetical protein